MTRSRLALGLCGAAALTLTACADRVIIDQNGLILDTDGETETATDSEGTDTTQATQGREDGGSSGFLDDSGCVPGEPECPCAPGEVPRGGVCVASAVDAMEPVADLVQLALAGDVVGEPPSVRVTSGGQPVAGITVSFGTAGLEGGQVGAAQAVSGADGIATAQSWTLGKFDGRYFVRASVPSEPEVDVIDFRGDTISDFEIVLHYVNPPNDAEAEAFESARLRWQAALINAHPAVQSTLSDLAAECGVSFDGGGASVTGVHIFVQLALIDGPGGENGNILGQAGPCSIRDDGSPYVGVMTFDTFDLVELEQSGSLETVILHEMGHVLGVGSLWSLAGLINNPSLPNNPGVDTFFVGGRASEVFFDLLQGLPFEGNIVPVENNAQFGSSDSHWRETVMVDELMSPRLGGAGEVAPLSALTIGSMGDLGYYVPNELAADDWSLPGFGIEGPPAELTAARETDVVLRPRWSRDAAGNLQAL